MNEELDPADAEFARRARVLLEGSAGSLSARARSRLTRARYAALELHAGGSIARSRAPWQRWLPAGAVSAAVLAVLLMQGGQPPTDAQVASAPPTASGDDLDLLADRDALALAQDQSAPEAEDDHAFYAWAAGAAQEEANGKVGS